MGVNWGFVRCVVSETICSFGCTCFCKPDCAPGVSDATSASAAPLMSLCSITELGWGSCPPSKVPFFTVIPAAQQLPLISRAPMFPADPTFTAKPVTVTEEGGTAGTVTGPSNETGTPEAPVRTTLSKVLVELEVFRNVNAPVARSPGIDPVASAIFDYAGVVKVNIRAATSRLVASGLLVTALIT